MEMNMKMERNQRSMLKVLESLSVAKMLILYVIAPPHTAEP